MYDDIYTDTFAELLEKFIILHIRTWHLEDRIANARSDKEVAFLKKKIDICFKEKRPMLIKAIDKMLFQILKGKI